MRIPCAERLDRYREIVPDWEAFQETLQRPLPQCIWTNTLRTTPERLASLLPRGGNPLHWCPGAFKGPPGFAPGNTIPFITGLYQIQEEVSLLPGVLLDAKPGERVLDLCAAPGSKTAQLAVAMRNSGTVIANDRDGVRMRAVRGTLDRLGVINTTVTVTDAVRYPDEAGLFDRVLVDAPCTCEGTSRKHPNALVDSGPDHSRGLHGLQAAILHRAVRLCRPGGRIVYATCTYAPEENEMVIDRILRESEHELTVLPAGVEGFTSSAGVTSWQNRSLDSSLSRAMRVWPHQNDTGGFFVAVLKKEGDSPATGTPVEPSEEEPQWMAHVTERFGFVRNVFDGMALLRPSNKFVTVTSRDHRGTELPTPVSVGMPLIRAALHFPKLTNAGAQLLGRSATRNVVSASPTQAGLYLARENFEPTAPQCERLTGTGYVIVLLEEIVLGLGVFHADQNRVSSMFPKEYSR